MFIDYEKKKKIIIKRLLIEIWDERIVIENLLIML